MSEETTMTMSAETILSKVRENKEALEKRTLERDSARQAVEQMGSDLLDLRADMEKKDLVIGEKDQAIEDLLAQNQELQESLAKYQTECEAMRSASTDKDRLLEELNLILV